MMEDWQGNNNGKSRVRSISFKRPRIKHSTEKVYEWIKKNFNEKKY